MTAPPVVVSEPGVSHPRTPVAYFQQDEGARA